MTLDLLQTNRQQQKTSYMRERNELCRLNDAWNGENENHCYQNIDKNCEISCRQPQWYTLNRLPLCQWLVFRDHENVTWVLICRHHSSHAIVRNGIATQLLRQRLRSMKILIASLKSSHHYGLDVIQRMFSATHTKNNNNEYRKEQNWINCSGVVMWVAVKGASNATQRDISKHSRIWNLHANHLHDRKIVYLFTTHTQFNNTSDNCWVPAVFYSQQFLARFQAQISRCCFGRWAL